MVPLLFLTLGLLNAQAADPELTSYISLIRAVDNHAHPMRLLLASEKLDPDVDALPATGIEEGPAPVRGRTDNPEYIAIWRELYGYPFHDSTVAHLLELETLRAKTIAAQGVNYPSWILDRMGIETMLSNRVAMGAGLPPARFQWIAFVDAFMYPLDNTNLKTVTPDRHVFFTDEEAILKRYIAKPAATLDAYAAQVTATIETMKREGVVGVKFEMAYLRTLEVDPGVPHDTAAALYARYAKGGTPSRVDYKKLQDFLFRHIAKEAGRLSLPVQIHTMAGGLGSTSSPPEPIRCCLNPSSTTPRCAPPSSFSFIPVSLGTSSPVRCLESPTCLPIFPPKPPRSTRAPWPLCFATGWNSIPNAFCLALTPSRPMTRAVGKSRATLPPSPRARRWPSL